MPFPVPLLPAILIAAGLGIGSMLIFRLASSRSYPAHTRFALAQVTEFLDGLPRNEMPVNEPDLIARLRSAPIDWNSCSMTSRGMADSWSVPVTAVFDRKEFQWSFRSAGEDREFNTSDDIQSQTRRPAK